MRSTQTATKKIQVPEVIEMFLIRNLTFRSSLKGIDWLFKYVNISSGTTWPSKAKLYEEHH